MSTLLFTVVPKRIGGEVLPALDDVLVTLTSTAAVPLFPLASGASVPFYLASDPAVPAPFEPEIVKIILSNAELSAALPLSAAATLAATQSIRVLLSDPTAVPAIDGADIISGEFSVSLLFVESLVRLISSLSQKPPTSGNSRRVANDDVLVTLYVKPGSSILAANLSALLDGWAPFTEPSSVLSSSTTSRTPPVLYSSRRS